MPAALKIPTIFTAVDKFSATVNKMNLTTNKFIKKTELGFSKISRASKKLKTSMSNVGKQFGKTGAIIAGLALGSGLMLGAQSFVQFDKSLTAASAKFGIFDKKSQGFKDLANVAKDIGSNTQFSAGEAGQGLNFLAMAGFSAKNAIKALPSVVNLAVAAETDLSEATDIASDAIGAFGLKNKDLGRIVDVMAKTTTTANTTMKDMFDAIKDGAPTAVMAGASMETISALIGKMANAGIKGSKAGTALKNIFLNLSSPTAKATKILKKLGVETVDGAGNLKDITVILGDLKKATIGMGTAAKASAFKEIFGKIGIAGATVLVNEGTQSLQDYRSELENSTGSAEKMAKFMGQGLFGVIASLKSAFESIAIAIGETFGSEIDSAIKSVTLFARNIQKWIVDNKSLIKTVFNIGVVIAKILIPVKALIIIIQLYKAALAAAELVQIAMATAVNATLWPILLVIAAIAAIILIVKNWAAISAWFSKIWNKSILFISEKWQILTKALKNFSFVNLFKMAGKAILDYLFAPLRSVLFLLAKLPGKVGEGAKFALDKIDGITNTFNVNQDKNGKLNRDAVIEKNRTERINKTESKKSTLEIIDRSGLAKITDNNNPDIQLSGTLGF